MSPAVDDGEETEMERDIVERLRELAVAGHVGFQGSIRSVRGALLDAADEIADLRADMAIAAEQAKQWAALTEAMSVEFADEPESVPGRNVGECAVALIRRLRSPAREAVQRASVTTDEGVTLDGYRAECPCGWRGRVHMKQTEAFWDAQAHRCYTGPDRRTGPSDRRSKPRSGRRKDDGK